MLVLVGKMSKVAVIFYFFCFF